MSSLALAIIRLGTWNKWAGELTGKRRTPISSSLLKNEESAAFSLFLPSLVWGLWCCERTLAYAASSLGIRIKL
jgi:hypothetical protein